MNSPLHPVRILLFSGDSALVKTAREAIIDLTSCRIEQVNALKDAPGSLQSDVGLSVLHLKRPGDEADIARLLQAAARSSIPAVVIDEVADPALTIRMLRSGAVDCLQRPLNITRLVMLIDVLTLRARHCPPMADVPELGSAPDVSEIDGFMIVSPNMRTLVDQVRQVADLSSSIILTGETGTGKSCLARIIHGLSARRAQPFLVVNCAALSPSLVESELFGHVRGAFTGADRNYEGKLARAGKGTLLLDEIDSLPLSIQGKLLRAVEERFFEPIGSNETRAMQARLIVASNLVLEDEVTAGRFRADLYFRLNVLGFHMPPLRQRPEVIPRLIAKYIAEFQGYHRGRLNGVAESALSALAAYHWPGNVRELRNVIERVVAVCLGARIELGDLPPAIQHCARRQQPEALSADLGHNELTIARRRAERQRIAEVLVRTNNNRSHAASELRISRVTLYKKLRRYGLA